ncbi:hypothetical protein QBC44DRAFT_405652 [Cladorrhinum sp. PSN332]|nr:hypothetical protein QBC44DRAFT_405652 [Cladorrhinum sp. PSN332]
MQIVLKQRVTPRKNPRPVRPSLGLESSNRALEKSKLAGTLSSMLLTPTTFLDDVDVLHEAAFNAASKKHLPICLENTRRILLDRIEEWADGDDDKSILWLKGMAGTGKSTIARTVARRYCDNGRLGASFFFRGGGDSKGGHSERYPQLRSS